MVLSQKDGIPDLVKTTKNTFSVGHTDWGFNDFAKWAYICNSANGYVTDGKVILSVTISLDEESDEESEESEDEVKVESKAVQTEPDLVQNGKRFDELHNQIEEIDDFQDKNDQANALPDVVPPATDWTIHVSDLDTYDDEGDSYGHNYGYFWRTKYYKKLLINKMLV